MRVGYARVSTQDQNPSLQLDALSAAGCDRTYEEKASGAQRDRPELKTALEYMRAGDILVVWKLDRLARSLGQLIETVANLEQRGIGFRSLTEQIDTTTAAGRLTFHIFGAMAEFERSIIRERTRAGLMRLVLVAGRAVGHKRFQRRIWRQLGRCSATRQLRSSKSRTGSRYHPPRSIGIYRAAGEQLPNAQDDNTTPARLPPAQR